MSANHRAVMNVKPSELAPGSPGAHLAAAQADAERMFGDAPVPVWNPSSRWRISVAGAAAATLAAGVAWGWLAGAPPAVVAAASRPTLATAPIVIAAAPDSAVTATGAAVTPGPAQRSSCENTAACRSPSPARPVEPELAAAIADPDAWALNPQPWRAVDPPSFVATVNTPVLPDEDNPTPGEETSPDDADATTQSTGDRLQ